MPEIKAFAPGIYARSEELVAATRDLDRKRTTEEAVAGQQLKDLNALLEVQQEAGLDFLSDGLLTWQDIFRPFGAAAEGLAPGPLTRFLNTNTFYRAPAVTAAAPRLSQPLGEPYFRVDHLPEGRWVATLPSPHALAEWATGDVSPRAIAEGILKPQLEWLADRGYVLVVLQDPALFGERRDLEGLGEALEAMASPLPLALQLPFGDAGKLIHTLAELPVDAIGVDFYQSDLADLPRPFPRTLMAGVIDARNSLLEEPEELVEFGNRIISELDPPELYLTTNGDLQFVPERIAREKLSRLGAAARTLKESA